MQTELTRFPNPLLLNPPFGSRSRRVLGAGPATTSEAAYLGSEPLGPDQRLRFQAIHLLLLQPILCIRLMKKHDLAPILRRITIPQLQNLGHLRRALDHQLLHFCIGDAGIL